MPKKMMIAQIGYTNYAIYGEDAAVLLEIAMRSRKLVGYGSPFTFDADNQPFVSRLEIGECDEPRATESDPIEPPPSAPDDDLQPF